MREQLYRAAVPVVLCPGYEQRDERIGECVVHLDADPGVERDRGGVQHWRKLRHTNRFSNRQI